MLIYELSPTAEKDIQEVTRYTLSKWNREFLEKYINVPYRRLPPGGPRLLFKGGSSLSKAYGLVDRFSEDIDVTVFRDDLGHPASAEEIASLSNTKRKAALDAIAEDCHAYVTGDLLAGVSEFLNADISGLGRVEIDETDASGQNG